MTVLTNSRHERFVQGLIAGATATAAYTGAGYSRNGAAQSAQRLLKNPQIQTRKAELKEKVVARFVAGEIADREYRLAVCQDVVDRIRALIDERAAAYSDVKPGGATGLLMRTVRTIGTGKRATRIEKYTFDKAVAMEVREYLKQAAIETGQWEEKQSHRLEKPEHADLRGMTAEELCIERDILLRAQAEAKARIEALRATKQIEAAPGTVEEVRGDQPPA